MLVNLEPKIQEPKNFRPRLTRYQVQIILNSLIDRQEYNPPSPSSREARELEGLRSHFETMEARSSFLIGRRGKSTRRPGGDKKKGDRR